MLQLCMETFDFRKTVRLCIKEKNLLNDKTWAFKRLQCTQKPESRDDSSAGWPMVISYEKEISEKLKNFCNEVPTTEYQVLKY